MTVHVGTVTLRRLSFPDGLRDAKLASIANAYPELDGKWLPLRRI
jgi:hypothetical protein